MGRCLREEFVKLHTLYDPLRQPVRVGTIGICNPDTGVDEVIWKEYPDWYALASEAGVEFPERGNYRVEDVMQSAWFFS